MRSNIISGSGNMTDTKLAEALSRFGRERRHSGSPFCRPYLMREWTVNLVEVLHEIRSVCLVQIWFMKLETSVTGNSIGEEPSEKNIYCRIFVGEIGPCYLHRTHSLRG